MTQSKIYVEVSAENELPQKEGEYFVIVPALSSLMGNANFDGKKFEGNFINQFARKDFVWLKPITIDELEEVVRLKELLERFYKSSSLIGEYTSNEKEIYWQQLKQENNI